jgi:hypothetical protein
MKQTSLYKLTDERPEEPEFLEFAISSLDKTTDDFIEEEEHLEDFIEELLIDKSKLKINQALVPAVENSSKI